MPNFAYTAFSEVRLKTNSQKFWAPHRHKKDPESLHQGTPARDR
jgi:hypothetical protein